MELEKGEGGGEERRGMEVNGAIRVRIVGEVGVRVIKRGGW